MYMMEQNRMESYFMDCEEHLLKGETLVGNKEDGKVTIPIRELYDFTQQEIFDCKLTRYKNFKWMKAMLDETEIGKKPYKKNSTLTQYIDWVKRGGGDFYFD